MDNTAESTRSARRGRAWKSPLWRRVRGEFMELPGLSLQVDQAARLFGVDRAETERILEALVRVGFLRRSTVGGFARNDSRP